MVYHLESQSPFQGLLIHVAGIGWLIRDDKGAFLKARSDILFGIYTPSEAEAMGLREVLSWLKNQNLTHFLIESDSLQVVQGLSSKSFDSSFDLIYVKDLLCIFPNAYISFVKRSTSRVVHLLARETLSSSDCMDWVNHPPSFLCNVLSSGSI
ncbi:uncharacterized protein LOC116033054 [Ipomoea triloba]|uniref:uncharacterized protein LOC116033054 n=1 Tax=Ipomoea triloba TaxID=35885 RepID=UPI00125D7F7A|nr:uncharacterized protein LOC116033054 [Ipomoea triloba]